MVGAVVRPQGSQKDVKEEKETEQKSRFCSFQFDKFPWLSGLMMVHNLLCIYTIFLNSYSAIINHVITYAPTNQIRSTLGFGFSGNLIGSLYFDSADVIVNVPDYISRSIFVDLVYLFEMLAFTVLGYIGARCKLPRLTYPLCVWLFLHSFFALGMLQQALFYSFKYKLNVTILDMHPVLAILVLAVATVTAFYVSLQVYDECTGNDEGNETEKISEQLKMTDSSDVKSTEVECSKFLRCCSRVFLILLGLAVLAFCLYIQVGVILLCEDPASLPSLTFNNKSYPTINGVMFYVKNDLDLKHEHEALPINLGFNLPMEFYSLKFNSICEDCDKFVVYRSYSSTSLMVVQATIWGLAAIKLLLNTIFSCCGSHTQSNFFRILLCSSLLHFYTIFIQSMSLAPFKNSYNYALWTLIAESVAGFFINLIVLVLFEICSARLDSVNDLDYVITSKKKRGVEVGKNSGNNSSANPKIDLVLPV
ncbi:uncharacterized protein LOC111710361 [Eurytemora carolleeae]|uniref:uncharacterized protein LOC111710361 n=1 Tax=Eurytemora carolleeae TaxID=1294199 RepID=UPI000C76711B|nr:uncharacterized protein LOC111710361 [Eurytemora carolleeae]|eukprot:XP_023340199.1 uncharacterized protein LOC111710361 [Eurytemora affinis]